MTRLANILLAASASPRTDAMMALLKDLNCDVAVCSGFEELMVQVRKSNADLAIVDTASPAFDGFDLVECLRRETGIDGVPAVLWSDASAPALFVRAAEVKADDVFVDPLDASEALYRLRPMLRLSTQFSELHRRRATARAFGVDPGDLSVLGTVDTSPFRVLVVDVENRESSMVARALGAQATVETSTDLGAAKDRLFEGDFDAAVLFLADASAWETGAAFCRDVRNHPRLFNMPLVVATPEGLFARPSEPYAVGASQLLTQPLDEAELRYVLATRASRLRLRLKIGGAMAATRTPATTDRLTGCYSKAFLEAHLESLIAATREWHKSLTLVVFRTAAIAEARAEHGPAAADQLLKQVVQSIVSLTRIEDAPAYLDDREIAVVLPDTPEGEAQFVMRRVAGFLGHTEFAIDDVFRPIGVTAEAGAAELNPEETAAQLLARAKKALG